MNAAAVCSVKEHDKASPSERGMRDHGIFVLRFHGSVTAAEAGSDDNDTGIFIEGRWWARVMQEERTRYQASHLIDSMRYTSRSRLPAKASGCLIAFD